MRFSNQTLTSLYVMVVVASTTLADVAADDVAAAPRKDNAKDDVVTDAGVLTSRVLQAVDPGCTPGYVDCVNGNDSVTGSSCAAACGVSCCGGNQACDQFTGKVCKDGSCTGNMACYMANLSFVVNRCIGVDACYSFVDPVRNAIFVHHTSFYHVFILAHLSCNQKINSHQQPHLRRYLQLWHPHHL